MIVSFLRTVVAEFVGLFYVLCVQSIMKNVVMASAATFYWLVVFCLANVILLTFFKNTDRSLGHFRFKLSQTSRPRNPDVELNFASDYSQ